MHVIARALAAAYVVLAVVAAGAYVQITGNYMNVVDVQENLGGNVRVAGVSLNWTGNPMDGAIAVVNFTVHNIGKVGILIVGINYDLGMNDTNDPRPWFDPGKRARTYVQSISISHARAQGIPVASGERRTVSSTVTIEPGTPQMAALDHADPSGKYHPYVWRPLLFYAFVDFELPFAPLPLQPFHEAEGVIPDG